MRYGLPMLVLMFAVPLHAQEPIVSPKAELEKLWSKGEFTEGPAHGPGGFVFFSDIGNRVMKFDPKTKKTVEFLKPSGRTNGLIFDLRGNLIACRGANTGGARDVAMIDPKGKVKALASAWQKKKFNSPNDLTMDVKGRIYFTDPRYAGDEKREIKTESIYRIDPNGKVAQVTTDVEKPNGILVSPDQQTLYVADNNPGGNLHLVAFPLKADGSVGKKRILHDFKEGRGIDGMAIDISGNVYATAGRGKKGGVYVFSPEGKQIGFIPTPETPTNCCFGGSDAKWLYITAGVSLYRIRTRTTGFSIYWPGRK